MARGLLILTNDEWNNAATEELSGPRVFSEGGPGRTPIPDLGLYAGPLLMVPKAELSTEVVQLAPAQLAPIEESVTELLGLDALLGQPRRAPDVQPGVIDYPRWSNIYYAGDPVGTPLERKRYLTVSHDTYNRTLGGAVGVRTTTSERRGGRTIPLLSDGVTKAVCVLPTFFTSHRADLRSRPRPSQLHLADMHTVAEALKEALVL